MATDHQDQLLQWGIVSIFAVLATIYSIVTPIFEASDELSHYPVIQHLEVTGELPVQRPGTTTLWAQEGSQPPLYYMLGAILTQWIDTSDLGEIRWLNPHAKLGIPLDPDNKNLIIHTNKEALPWHGTVLAVHLIRFLSVLCGTITVNLTYLIAQEIIPHERWVPPLAAALTAFNPMFLFITGSVNNDNLTVMLSSLVILLCLRIVSKGITFPRASVLIVGCALATVSKISGLTLFPLIGIALLLYAWKSKDLRSAIFVGLGLIGTWAVLASWWYIRNLVLYHELLGLITHVAVAGGRQISIFQLFQNEWYGFWVSYWALFGAVDVLADRWVYWFYTALTYLALGGIILWLSAHIRARTLKAATLHGMLILQIIVVFAGVIRWTLTTYASQGRLMFPAIGALSVIAATGLIQITPSRYAGFVASSVAIPLGIIATIVPFRYIAPTYALPPTVENLPTEAMAIGADFQGLELVGLKIEPSVLEVGDRIPVTLYWKTMSLLDEDYSIYLHALGRDGNLVGNIDSMPGAGALPTTRMQPGQIIQDEYSLELLPDFEAPTIIQVQIGVGILRRDSYEVIEPVLFDGEHPTSISTSAGVAYPATDARSCKMDTLSGVQADATLGGFASLWLPEISWTAPPGGMVPISLIWDRLSDTPIDWTVFVHLVNGQGEVIAQADAPPVAGYYPTSQWHRQCQVLDQHLLEVPETTTPGTYSVLVGLYDPSDPAYPRAVAADANGTILRDYAVHAGEVQVVTK